MEEVLRRRVADPGHPLGEHDAAAEATDRRVEAVDATLHRDQRVREAHPVRVVQVEPTVQIGPEFEHRLERRGDLGRIREPHRRRERHLVDARLDGALDDPEGAFERNTPLVGAVEARPDPRLYLDVGVGGELDDRLDLVEVLRDAHVLVLPAVALAHRHQRVHLVHPGLDRALHPDGVGHERTISHVVVAVDPRGHLVGITQRRHRFRMGERGDLDLVDARRAQLIDECDFPIGRDEFVVALEAVPREHLDERHLVGCRERTVVHQITSRSANSSRNDVS